MGTKRDNSHRCENKTILQHMDNWTKVRIADEALLPGGRRLGQTQEKRLAEHHDLFEQQVPGQGQVVPMDKERTDFFKIIHSRRTGTISRLWPVNTDFIEASKQDLLFELFLQDDQHH